MNRRSFLGSILALGAAPAIVRADALMRVVPRSAPIIVGCDFGAFTSEALYLLDKGGTLHFWPVPIRDLMGVAPGRVTIKRPARCRG
jgi:hypothetical protein